LEYKPAFALALSAIFLLASITTQFAKADWREEKERAAQQAREAADRLFEIQCDYGRQYFDELEP